MAASQRRLGSAKGTPNPPVPRVSVEGDGAYVLIHFEGVLSVRRMESVIQEVVDRDDFVPGMGTLWDLRAADLSNVTSGDLRYLRQSRTDLAPRRGAGRVALLATDDLTFGISRMVEASTAVPGISIMVFRDEGQAVSWVSGGEPPGS